MAIQLGYGLEPVRAWVTQADSDEGKREGVPSDSLLKFVDLNRNCGK